MENFMEEGTRCLDQVSTQGRNILRGEAGQRQVM